MSHSKSHKVDDDEKDDSPEFHRVEEQPQHPTTIMTGQPSTKPTPKVVDYDKDRLALDDNN
jgi:hypothetical protein